MNRSPLSIAREDASLHASPLSAREAALGYLSRGWSVIPIEPRAKRPLTAWLEFQNRCASPREIDAWFASWPDANVGIVTGRVSGLVVIDVDARHGGEASLTPARVRARRAARHGRSPHRRRRAAPLLRASRRQGREPRRAASGTRSARRRRLRGRAAVRASERAAIRLGARPFAGRKGACPAAELAAAGRARRGARGTRPRTGAGSRAKGPMKARATPASPRSPGTCCGARSTPRWWWSCLLAWNRARCRPPLEDAEVAGVVESIARLHREERFRSTT